MTVPLLNAKLTASPTTGQIGAHLGARRTPTRGAQVTPAALSRIPHPRPGLRATAARRARFPLDVDFAVLYRDHGHRIRATWDQKQGAAGETPVKLTIQRDGNSPMSRTSGRAHDATRLAAMRAAYHENAAPLPDAFPNPTLTVHLNFQYK